MQKNLITIAIWCLLIGLSSHMVYSQLSMFLKYELHVSEDKIALVDGFAELLSNFARVFSGTISDFFRNRKLMLVIGSGIVMCIRPLFSICTSLASLSFVLSVDRMASGIISSPRDALISDISKKQTLNRSYGISKIAKTIGSFCGIFLAIFLLKTSILNYKLLFVVASIPAAISFVLATKICESPSKHTSKENRKFNISDVASLDRNFWKLVCFVFLFELAHFSDSLLTIRASNFCAATEATYTAIFISLGQIVFTYPISYFADKFSWHKMLVVCIIMAVISNLLLLLAWHHCVVFLAALFWGGQMSSTAALSLSMISVNVNPAIKGTAIGIYYIAVGAGYFISGAIAGFLWKNLNCHLVFLYSISVCIVCVALHKKLCTCSHD